MTDEEFEEVMDWQMSEVLKRRSPQWRRPLVERCLHCNMEWHGLPKGGCETSFELPDTPNADR